MEKIIYWNIQTEKIIMKNFIVSILLIAITSLLLQLYLPWWIIAVTAFAVALFIKQNSFMAFLSGFIAIFLLWTVYAFILSFANENILVVKVADLMKALTKGSPVILYLITGLVGGLVGGFGGLTGSIARKLK